MRAGWLFLILCGSCGGGSRAELPAAPAGGAVFGVRVAKPRDRVASELVRATGSLRAKNEAVLSAPATGTMARLFVEVGARVERGAALVQLDTSNVEILVDQARAARDLAQAGFDAATVELERMKQLRQSDAAPVAALDRVIAAHKQAAAGLAQAEAAVRSAEEGLRDHTLRAPFSGVVSQRFKNLGETVAMMPPTPIVTIVDTDNLEVRTTVPETVVDFITVGSVAKGVVNPAGVPFTATVISVGVVVDAATRGVEILAKVTTPVTREMRPGSLVELDFSEALAADKVAGFYVPTQAVRGSGDGASVLVVVGDTLEERAVKAEPVTPGTMRIREGLSGQEDVVIEGAASLKAGLKVKVSGQS